MTQVKFVRTTHENGRCQSFPADAWKFWREHGATVGEVLRSEAPLTFAEVVASSQEIAFEYPESGFFLALDEEHIAWCLVKLLEYGMAGVVTVPLRPT